MLDQTQHTALVLPLDAEGTLAASGGKGLNLARLTRAGFPVPAGFVLTTEAYRQFVAANDLGPRVAEACAGLDAADPSALEAASASIRETFVAGQLPGSIADAVRSAWAGVFSPDASVAVRSSATAEDLPDLSFAGQQDTYLNIIGPDAALDAVVRCWASLFTARAIGYRMRNGIPHDDVALAVVVQRLVPAEVSGVLFTVNPLTGARGETVIDATFGLGEALVSGQVEPDHLVVDAAGAVTRALGAKAVATTPDSAGGVSTSEREPGEASTLTDAQARELAALGRQVADALGGPQDIEWTLAGGEISLVQARPITSLFPIPDGPEEAIWFSFGAVQGMLQPITPLGRDAITTLLSGVSQLAGPRVDFGAAGYLRPAGERLWLRLDRLLRHPIGARLLPRVLPVIEPGSAAIIADIAAERGWTKHAGRPSPATVRRVAGVAAWLLPRVPRTLADPVGRRRAVEAAMDEIVRDVEARLARASEIGDPDARLLARVGILRDTLTTVFPLVGQALAPVSVPGLGMMATLSRAAGKAGERGRVLALEVLRSVPGNPTTEMDLALWRVASTVQADAESRSLFEGADADRLAALFAAGGLPRVAQDAVAGFLDEYGARGVGEIDLGQPRWRDNPVDVLRTVQSYVGITDAERAPDAVFARGEQTAARATRELAGLLAGRGVLARVEASRWRFVIDRVRNLVGVRETPKFTIIRLFGALREALVASGKDLVASGVLERPEDVFYLHLDELDRFTPAAAEGWRALVTERRGAAERERLRRQIPRVLLGDGRAFYEGLGRGDGAIKGSPVSPGVVEGAVRVVFDPNASGLQPGEILVCPGTDPAWTPLFLTAGGLITEVGGMMTHGSVVAREYGIPAVVGVHEATTRLVTGQRIRLDGTSGTIELLDDRPL